MREASSFFAVYPGRVEHFQAHMQRLAILYPEGWTSSQGGRLFCKYIPQEKRRYAGVESFGPSLRHKISRYEQIDITPSTRATYVIMTDDVKSRQVASIEAFEEPDGDTMLLFCDGYSPRLANPKPLGLARLIEFVDKGLGLEVGGVMQMGFNLLVSRGRAEEIVKKAAREQGMSVFTDRDGPLTLQLPGLVSFASVSVDFEPDAHEPGETLVVLRSALPGLGLNGEGWADFIGACESMTQGADDEDRSWPDDAPTVSAKEETSGKNGNHSRSILGIFKSDFHQLWSHEKRLLLVMTLPVASIVPVAILFSLKVALVSSSAFVLLGLIYLLKELSGNIGEMSELINSIMSNAVEVNEELAILQTVAELADEEITRLQEIEAKSVQDHKSTPRATTLEALARAELILKEVDLSIEDACRLAGTSKPNYYTYLKRDAKHRRQIESLKVDWRKNELFKCYLADLRDRPIGFSTWAEYRLENEK